MIISEIKGGFGNQLFSYACSYTLAKDHQDKLILDKNIYDLGYFRPFELDSLKIDYDTLLLRKQIPFDRYAHPFKTKLYQLKRACKIGFFTKKVIEENEFEYHPETFTYEGKIHISGYWQNYRYFHKYAEDIQRQFLPKKPFSKEISDFIKKLKSENSICLHIRRGDYAKFKGGKCLSMDFYFQALNLMEEAYGKEYTAYVFSDDIAYVKDVFQHDKRFHYISDVLSPTDFEEFFLMSSCRNHIIANSTYSWWAAYLNSNKEKLVIAPEVDLWKKDYYPDDWKVLKTDLA